MYTLPLILMVLMWNLLEVRFIHRQFKKKQLLFDDRYTETMCMAITLISSFAMALYLELLLPSDRGVLYLLPVLVGLAIGLKFGAILKPPAVLNGIYNGALGGIMGKMLGAVLQNPALCKIPIESETMIATNMYSFVLFTACLHALISHLIRYSLKS